MSLKPMVSVVIPFYKGADWLKQAIDSVYAGTYDRFEIIVVNDGSAEKINDIVKEYDERLIYKEQQNSGPAIARNNGIKASKGKYIAFLDSDDYWEKEKLERQVQLMQQHGFAWSHTAYTNFKDGINEHEYVKVSHIQGSIYPWCMYSSKIATPCVMIKTSVLKENGFGFEEDMRYGQDSMLWFRLSSFYNIGLVNDCLVHVRKTGENASLNVTKQLLVRAQIWSKIKGFDEKKLKKVKSIGKLSYKWCALCSKPIKKLPTKTPQSVSKFLSIVLYAPAYMGFKLAARQRKQTK